MAGWTYAQYKARMEHETRGATSEKGKIRLTITCREVERYLEERWPDKDHDGWVDLLSTWVNAATIAGLRIA